MKRVFAILLALVMAPVGLMMTGCTLETSPYGYGYGNGYYYDDGYSPYYYPAYRPYHVYRYRDEHHEVHRDHHDDGVHVEVR